MRTFQAACGFARTPEQSKFSGFPYGCAKPQAAIASDFGYSGFRIPPDSPGSPRIPPDSPVTFSGRLLL